MKILSKPLTFLRTPTIAYIWDNMYGFDKLMHIYSILVWFFMQIEIANSIRMSFMQKTQRKKTSMDEVMNSQNEAEMSC